MSIIATAVKHLMAAGVTGEALLDAIAELEAAQPKDAAAERRRAWDRERKRRQREEALSGGNPVESAETVDAVETPSLSPSPKEKISNPHPHTHPDITTRAREAFPKPDWCPDQVWIDLKANRKAKHLACTASAHAKLLRDLDKLADDEWPPGRLLEAIVARGWGAAYDPREDRKPTNGTSRPQRLSTRQIGERFAARLASGGRSDPDLVPRLGAAGGYDRG